jgi:glucose-fructose oxidoreductase
MSEGKDRKARYAIVGLGHIAQVAVLPAFANAQNSELVALVSSNDDKLAELSARYDVQHAVHYDDYDQLLTDGIVDAVYIALPNHLHHDYTIRAAERGVHVLCEKPMAVTEDECRDMIETCDEHDVRLMIAYRLHFEEGNMEAVRLARDGALGEPRLFHSIFAQDVKPGDVRLYPLHQGGGPVYDMGVYCINAARYLFRDEPIEVTAFTGTRPDERFEDVEEMTSAMLRFSEDRLASFTVSFGAVRIATFELVGTAGRLWMEPAYHYATESTLHVEIESAQPRQDRYPKRDQFGPQLIHFSDCILNNRKPEPDGWEGLADIRVVEAIYQSARSGESVRLEKIDRKRRPGPEQVIVRPSFPKPKEIQASGPSD